MKNLKQRAIRGGLAKICSKAANFRSRLGSRFASLGMVGRRLKIALVIAPLVITGYALGLPYGPEGVALGFSAAMTLWVIPHFLWASHDTVIIYQDVLSVVSRPLLSGVVGASAAFAVIFLLGPTSPFTRLLLGGTVLFVVYAWMLVFVMAQKPLYLDLVRSLKTRSAEEVLAST